METWSKNVLTVNLQIEIALGTCHLIALFAQTELKRYHVRFASSRLYLLRISVLIKDIFSERSRMYRFAPNPEVGSIGFPRSMRWSLDKMAPISRRMLVLIGPMRDS